MKRESVTSFIDRRILQNMQDGFPINIIKKDLDVRYKNMSRGILNDMTVDEFEEVLLSDLETIQNSRVKYTSFYVSHARKRMADLDWITSKKDKFPTLSTSQIFNLIKLKEKLAPSHQNQVIIIKEDNPHFDWRGEEIIY
jgi:hypothetical protein